MTITQTPAAISLSGNLPDLIITSESSVTFKLEVLEGETYEELINETLTPEAGIITVDLRLVVEQNLIFTLPDDAGTYTLQASLLRTFRYTVDSTTGTFDVMRGGIDNPGEDFDAAVFLSTNFLTWQPQNKYILTRQNEFLTFYFAAGDVLKAKLYYKVDDEVLFETVDAFSNTSGVSGVYTVDVSYARLQALLVGQVLFYIDCWVESSAAVVKSYLQRYLPVEEGDDDQLYYFVNTLGGFDTLLCKGALTRKHSIVNERVAVLKTESEVNRSDTSAYIQNTGYAIDKGNIGWTLDFFLSEARYHVTTNSFRKILLPGQDLSWDPAKPSTFSFEFEYSDATPYNYVNRAENLPLLSEYPDPTILYFERRLSDFDLAPTLDDLLMPVQFPYNATWYKMTFAAIIDKIVTQLPVANNLTTTEEGKVLDARQGKILNETKLDIISLAFQTVEDIDAIVEVGEYSISMEEESLNGLTEFTLKVSYTGGIITQRQISEQYTWSRGGIRSGESWGEWKLTTDDQMLKIDKTSIANTLTETEEGKVLDARQGKVLGEALALIAETLGTKADLNGVVINIDFNVLEPFTYNVPQAMKLTYMSSEGDDPALSIALNTEMEKYTKLTITPSETGLVTLIGTLTGTII